MAEGELIEQLEDVIGAGMADGAAVEVHKNVVGGVRDMFAEAVELYKAVIGGNKSKVLELCQEEELRHTNLLTTLKDTVLHIAAYSQKEDLTMELLRFYSGDTNILTKRNVLGDTILHEAATTDMVNVAAEMLKAAPDLLTTPNFMGEIPLFVAAHFGQRDMFNFLAHQMDDWIKVNNPEAREDYHFGYWRRRDTTTILHIAILAEFFDIALEIVNRYPALMDYRDKQGMTGLQLLSTNASAFRSGSNYGLMKKIIYYCLPSSETDVPHGSDRVEGSYHGSETNNHSKRLRDPYVQPTYRTCMALYTVVAS
ncbi:hypothetical protein HHK36_005697 [Tetracentron sinense]|uniref:Uncharacterized protein n=1 Tax=Tetracentron sinense TaxID=13715 RepID=A0A834ZL19_TETSI|nr:hypothetical protein HHK36_005697 [Tetracentron sinense]